MDNPDPYHGFDSHNTDEHPAFRYVSRVEPKMEAMFNPMAFVVACKLPDRDQQNTGTREFTFHMKCTVSPACHLEDRKHDQRRRP